MNPYISKAKSFVDLYRTRRTLPFRYLVSVLKIRYHNGVMRDLNLTGNSTNKKALLAHVMRPFVINRNSYLFKKHQSNWKPIQITKSLNNKGFNVDVYGRESNHSISNLKEYDLLFGINPHFSQFAPHMPDDTECVYYIAGMHWTFENEAVERRIQDIERRRGTRLPKTRNAEPRDLSEADHIILVGDDYTRTEYLRRLPNDPPVHLITNAGFDELNVLSNGPGVTKQFPDCNTNFLWLAGNGPILKGLDLALDAFRELPQLDLYVCGPIDRDTDFVDEYHQELFELENIHTVGWVDLFSSEFEQLADKCGFHLSPSCSEGISGAVINSLHRGVIPITTKEVGIDTRGFGFSIDPNLESIKQTVREASSLSETEIEERSHQAAEQARTKYSREQFVAELDEAISDILEREHCE